jgi:hypothetical protein
MLKYNVIFLARTTYFKRAEIFFYAAQLHLLLVLVCQTCDRAAAIVGTVDTMLAAISIDVAVYRMIQYCRVII